MPSVFLGIGSNIDLTRHIKAGLAHLQQQFGSVLCSPVYQSHAVGFGGADFYNLVAQFDTDLEISTLHKALREIEKQVGRKRTTIDSHIQSRHLDLDILLYADVIDHSYGIPRKDITEYAFVLKPLADLAPTLLHPVLQITIADLWQQFNKTQPTHNLHCIPDFFTD